jgi:hypothetical protein
MSCYSIFFLSPESGLAAPFLLPTVVGIFARRILFYAGVFILLLLPGLAILTLGWLDQGSTMLATALLEAIGLGIFVVWSLKKVNRGANEVIEAIQTRDQEIELLHREIHEKPKQQYKLVCLHQGWLSLRGPLPNRKRAWCRRNEHRLSSAPTAYEQGRRAKSFAC